MTFLNIFLYDFIKIKKIYNFYEKIFYRNDFDINLP